MTKKVFIHGGRHHADDAMAVALLKTFFKNIDVVRTNDINIVKNYINNDINNDIIVVDFGGGRYDHHQKNTKVHSDGTKYCGCTLVFEELKDQLFNTKQGAEDFKEIYLRPIELHDNGVVKSAFADIANVNSQIFGNDDLAFWSTVAFFEKVIAAKIADDIIPQISDEEANSEVLYTDEFVNTKSLTGTQIKYVCLNTPDGRNAASIICVPKGGTTFEVKQSLPQEWLKNPPAGCTFVHQGRFMAAFDSYEAACRAVATL